MSRPRMSDIAGASSGVETMQFSSVEDTGRGRSPEHARGVIGRVLLQVRQLLCGLRGHDTLFHFDECRVSVVCTRCGYESPGWVIPGAGASSRRPATRHVQPSMVSDPRAA